MSKGATGNRFGEIAVREGFASRDAVRECLEIQSKLKSFGVEPKRLGEIMVEKGFLQAADVKAVLEVQRAGGSRIESRAAVPAEKKRRAEPKARKSPSKATRSKAAQAPDIPGYEILDLLGEGGMGMVYRARQVSLDRTVAMKVLPPRAAKETAFIKRFISEARTVARLNHEHIIAGIDVGEVDGTYYFVMEYVEGESVADLIDRVGPLDEHQALELALQVTKALEHAHKHGLVHRDIKPQNVLVTSAQQAKLCDLGLAKVQNEAPTDPSGVPIGTPHYLSPEQARGEADVDIRSDIYSLGATLFHMLTGETPFEGHSPMVLMTKHLTEDVTPPKRLDPKISKGASDLVVHMMAKDKEDRPQTPTQVREDLERVLEGKKPASARGTSGRASKRRSGRRGPPRASGATRTRNETSGASPRRGRAGNKVVLRAGRRNETINLLMIPIALAILVGSAVWMWMNTSVPGVTDAVVVTEADERAAESALREARGLEPTAAKDAYRTIIRQYPGTRAADLARDYLAE